MANVMGLKPAAVLADACGRLAGLPGPALAALHACAPMQQAAAAAANQANIERTDFIAYTS